MCLTISTRSKFARIISKTAGYCLVAAKEVRMQWNGNEWEAVPSYYSTNIVKDGILRYDMEQCEDGIVLEAPLNAQEIELHFDVDDGRDTITITKQALGIHVSPLVKEVYGIFRTPSVPASIWLEWSGAQQRFREQTAFECNNIADKTNCITVIPVLVPYSAVQLMGTNGEMICEKIIVPRDFELIDESIESVFCSMKTDSDAHYNTLTAWKEYLSKSLRRFHYCLTIHQVNDENE